MQRKIKHEIQTNSQLKMYFKRIQTDHSTSHWHTALSFNGSALGISIVISLMVALVSSFFVLRTHLSKISELRYDLKKILITNSESGIQLLLGNPHLLPINDSTDISLFNEQLDSVRLCRLNWGLYEINRSKAHAAAESFELTALIGTKFPPKGYRTGLYLSDMDKPIGITGDSKLGGISFLPDEGVKRVYLDGKHFNREKIYVRPPKQSGMKLPAINSEIIGAIAALIHGTFPSSYALIDFYETEMDSISAAYDQTTMVYYTNGELILSNITMSGNIILRSSSRIIVESGSKLSNVILIAPEITVASGFEGPVQIFASNSIDIEENVRLGYPSALGLIAQPDTTLPSQHILMGNNVSIDGNLFALPEITEADANVSIKSGENFLLRGELYCSGTIDLKGTIQGSCYAVKTVSKTNSAYYENVILDLSIDPDQLDEEFAIGSVLSNTHKHILEWL